MPLPTFNLLDRCGAATPDVWADVNFSGTTLTGGSKIGEGVWESADKKFIYVQQGQNLVIGERSAAGASTVGGTIYSVAGQRIVTTEIVADWIYKSGARRRFDLKNRAANDSSDRRAA